MQSETKVASWQIPAITVIWACALFGILQVRYLDFQSRHSICGAWGCGPSLPPLIAFHGFWAVLISFPTILACRGLVSGRLLRLGWWVSVLGLTGLVVVGIWDIVPAFPNWLPRVNNIPSNYIVHRYLLAVVTLVDIPVVQITLAGITCFITAKVRISSRNRTFLNDECDLVYEDRSSPAERV